jgi:preprotein translocase subunit SecY
VRSGQQTEAYLAKIVNRLTFFGAISLGLLALAPLIAQIWVPVSITVSGTSILILVSVALQTLRSVESRALMVTYDQYEQPDFFHEPSTPLEAASGARRLRFVPRRGKKSK